MSENTDEGHRRAGIGMLVASWVVLLGLAAFAYDGWLGRLYNPNQDVETRLANTGERVVTLRANRQHQYVSSGTIMGEPVVFMLDTGATDVVISAELAQQLSLPRLGSYIARTANGEVRVFATEIQSLSLGDIVLENVDAAINPAMYGRDVLLGMSALRDLEIRKADGVMTLVQ